MRGSELMTSGFGPPEDGMYVGSGPEVPVDAGAGAVAGLGVAGPGAHASSSSATPTPPAVKRRNRRRLGSPLVPGIDLMLVLLLVRFPEPLEICLRRRDRHRRRSETIRMHHQVRLDAGLDAARHAHQ